MLPKEYRIPMPFAVDEYRVGQLYMISKHSNQNTTGQEGIQVITNEPIDDPEHGRGQFTEKRIHAGGSLPAWVRALIPRFFYVTEKAWNYYPYTITVYTCSFLPRLSLRVVTRYENNCGDNGDALKADKKDGAEVEVDLIDISKDPVPEKHKHDCPDLTKFTSAKTGRGPLNPDGWMKTCSPVMCSYKYVEASFEVWGLQTKVEKYMHKVVRDVLLVGHIQAFAWIDEWHGMTMEDLREYERKQIEEMTKRIAKEEGQADGDDERPLSAAAAADGAGADDE